MARREGRFEGKNETMAAAREARFLSVRREVRRAGECGYTLIEALVVLTILAFAVGMLAPRLKTIDGFDERRLSAGLVSDIHTLRDDAIRGGVTTALLLQNGEYVLEPAQLRRTIPANATLNFDVGDPLRLNDGAERLLFFPDGSANGARLTVMQGGRSDTIIVSSIDGAITHAAEK